MKISKFGYPMRTVVKRVTQQCQTYRVWVELECGHKTSWTVSRLRIADWDPPKTTSCHSCGQVPGWEPPWRKNVSKERP